MASHSSARRASRQVRFGVVVEGKEEEQEEEEEAARTDTCPHGECGGEKSESEAAAAASLLDPLDHNEGGVTMGRGGGDCFATPSSSAVRLHILSSFLHMDAEEAEEEEEEDDGRGKTPLPLRQSAPSFP